MLLLRGLLHDVWDEAGSGRCWVREQEVSCGFRVSCLLVLQAAWAPQMGKPPAGAVFIVNPALPVSLCLKSKSLSFFLMEPYLIHLPCTQSERERRQEEEERKGARGEERAYVKHSTLLGIVSFVLK